MMNDIDRKHILITNYMHARANSLNPAMLAYKEQILEDMTRLRQLCELADITQEQLDAMWETRQRGKRR
jgi:hypothetical protein